MSDYHIFLKRKLFLIKSFSVHKLFSLFTGSTYETMVIVEIRGGTGQNIGIVR